MDKKWHKFDPDKGLPHATVVLIFCKDGKTYAGTQLDASRWEAMKHGRYIEEHSNAEILYWTENLGTPPEVVKVFISQPMSGRTVQEIKDERANTLAEFSHFTKFKDAILIEIDSFHENALNNSNPITELGKCISLMTNADFVIFCKGWDKSKGCRVEFEVAKQYGIPHGWIDEYHSMIITP